MEKSALTLCLMVFNPPPPSNPPLLVFLSYGLKKYFKILIYKSVGCPMNTYNSYLQKLYINLNTLTVKSFVTIKVEFFETEKCGSALFTIFELSYGFDSSWHFRIILVENGVIL